MRERFLAIHMFAALNRGHSRNGVEMIGRRDQYSVDFLLHRIEHFAKIAKLFGIWEFLECPGSVAGIHVAKGDDIGIRGQSIDIGAPHAANTDGGKIGPFAWRRGTASGYQMAGHNQEGRYRCACGSEEISSAERLW